MTETKYQFLTPNDEAEHIEEYSNALSEALNDDKVKNIAISGSYGSGKSSFIKTFEKKHNSSKQKVNLKFLDISLATFNKKDGNEKIDISLIEKSILEQMFYKVKSKYIPQSRLNKINRLSFLPLKVISILLFIFFFIITFKSELISKIVLLKDIMEFLSKDYLKYLPILILIYGSYCLLKKLLLLLSNTNLSKVNLKDLELASNSKDDESLLNKHLDEILYFFEKTKFNVVVFQDLDRFENLEIFTKLRELNNFINNSEQVNRKVVFIYAVKDEMFTNAHQRTKFFDFLIPIIPYINATNSKDKLLDYFKDDVKHSFLYDVSLYISDMRLLKNIYNEYQIYSSNLDEKLNKTELLAMIIYKNFEPQDFEKLHKHDGLVFDLFNNKSQYIETLVENLNNQIIRIQNKINESDNEPQNKIDELQKIYLLKIIENFGENFNGKLLINNTTTYELKIIKSDEFKNILESESISSEAFGYYTPRTTKSNNISFKSIENDVNSNYSYKEREQFILDKFNAKKDEHIFEIQKIEEEKTEIENYSIKKIINNFDIDIFSDDFKEKELLKYLISYGHINKDYSMYMSNFFGVSITKEEQDFLLNIKNNGKHFNYDYELNNLEEILKKERLDVSEFKKEAVLNFTLFEYIMVNKSKYPKQYVQIFKQISNKNEISSGFLFSFLEKTKKVNQFINGLFKYYPSIIQSIIANDNFTSKQRDNYIYEFIHNLEYNDILKSNENDSLKIYMESKDNFYIPNETYNKRIMNLIEDFDIKFDFFKEDKENLTPYRFIYENNHYKLNKKMINNIVNVENNFDSEIVNSLQKSHYTTIANTNVDKLKEYIDENINEYIKDVFLDIQTNNEESEESIIQLLNNGNIENTLKSLIIKKQNNKISNIDIINSNLWTYLLENNKLITSWTNISKYYNYKEKLDENLIKYLNNQEVSKELSLTIIDKNYVDTHSGFKTKFLREIIEENNFNIESYSDLVKGNNYYFDNLHISKLDIDKINVLVNDIIFKFGSKNFNLLKEYTKKQGCLFLEKNINSFIDKLKDFEVGSSEFEFNIDTDDITYLLKSQKLTKKNKIDIIENIDYDLITNSAIANKIYSLVDKKIARPLYYIVNMVRHLEYLESKINLILEQPTDLGHPDELMEAINELPDEYRKICNQDGTQTVLSNTEYNKKFIRLLHEKEFITSDKEEKGKKIRLFIKKK